jgi:hypothetical protein
MRRGCNPLADLTPANARLVRYPFKGGGNTNKTISNRRINNTERRITNCVPRDGIRTGG